MRYLKIGFVGLLMSATLVFSAPKSYAADGDAAMWGGVLLLLLVVASSEAKPGQPVPVPSFADQEKVGFQTMLGYDDSSLSINTEADNQLTWTLSWDL